MSEPQLSIVVVTRDRSARLERLLNSLARQTAPASALEVIVVDDASSDGTAALLASAARTTEVELKPISVTARPGIAELRNIGWRAARATHVAFIDDDCEATEGWAEKILAAIEDMPASGLQGRTTPSPSELADVGPLTRSKLIEGAGPWYQTCNIVYPRGLLERLGGFDARYRVAGEDTDLGWRAREAGAAIAYVRAAHVHHAVERIGIAGWIAVARRERILAPLFRDHRGLREQVASLGVFKGAQRSLFVIALVALIAARRHRVALLAAMPYARLLAARCRAVDAGPGWACWYVAYDAIALLSAVRGAGESRSPFI